MAIINNIKAVTEALDVAMERDKNVIVFGEDVGLEGGVFRATQGLQQKYGIERSFNAPISEAMFAGVGLGMAMNGMKPVVELQFQGLGLPALQNVIANISRMRNRSRGKWTAPMVIRMPMGGGIRALEHHSEALEAIFAHIPGIKTVMPSTPYDTKGLLLAAIESPDPIIVLEPTKLYRAFKQEVPEGYYTVPIGEGYKIQEGNDLTIVTYGAQTVDCMKAIELVKSSHPNATIELIDLRSIQPWDKKMVIESVKKTGRLLVVSEAVRSFGVPAEIITTVNEHCFDSLKAPLSRCTGYDVVIPYDRGEGFHQVNPQKVVEAIKKVLDYKF
ncbi:alpha-ketoacid dehydrogenase subunit beta [Spiroplasma monobiae]|uniref:Pyruvate dehydrogenase E1 component subunit beta n=1 Tax=Spiroplasma monobiae MQ-1 TaxID=1336748 RepID=A0A2K9LVK8_SPISQ|nr:alpha-ketoacid dehydrogenase subunit beta [Spiroplasma monobiae]AUM62375.1 pyruvate dehydrogenase E1 component subunit beta [Spiroplasma monobiae MQ-1]